MFRQVSFAGCRKGFADAVFRKHVADPVELLRGSVGLMQYQKVGSFWLLIQRVSAGKAAIQSVGGFDHIVQPGESEQAQQVDGGFRLGFIPTGMMNGISRSWIMPGSMASNITIS